MKSRVHIVFAKHAFLITLLDMHFSLSDYDYTLPPELIAQEAAHPADSARMMVIDRSSGEVRHESTFRNFTTYTQPGDLVVFNDTRVIPSRLRFEK